MFYKWINIGKIILGGTLMYSDTSYGAVELRERFHWVLLELRCPHKLSAPSGLFIVNKRPNLKKLGFTTPGPSLHGSWSLAAFELYLEKMLRAGQKSSRKTLLGLAELSAFSSHRVGSSCRSQLSPFWPKVRVGWLGGGVDTAKERGVCSQ